MTSDLKAPSSPPLDPPVAARRPHDVSVHGETRIDDYFWLRHKTDPAVIAHLHAEKAYADAWFRPLDGFREALYREMLARIQEDDEGVPYRRRGHWYWSRTEAGRAYPIQVRRRDAPGAPEEVLIDLNELARDKPFLQQGAAAVSPDSALLAYSLDETGALDFTLRVKEIASGRDLGIAIEKTEDAAWGNDSRTLYYLTKDAAMRTHRLWRHRLGSTDGDALLHEEADERFWLSLGKTRDERYIVLSADSKDTSDVRVIDADAAVGDAAGALRQVLPRRTGVELALDHRDGRFYLLVNDTGRNFRLVETSAARPSLAEARELIAHRADVMLEDVDLFADHMVVTERERGVLKLRIWRLADASSRHVAFDEAVYSARGNVNAEFETTSFRFAFDSFVTPRSIFDVDMATLALTLKKRQPVQGGYDPANYHAEQFMARAEDGTAVPVSLVWRRDLRDRAAGAPQPLLLYGYGSYGHPSDVNFASARVSLLDRGVIFAIAHVRGGGDLGRTWYDEGKLAKKMTSFTDFVACAEALIERGFTDAARLIAHGASAGGLLVGAAVNLRPDLFKAVVAEVPFLDVVTTMLDESLPLTVGEFLEWGNPKVRADYETMRRYSPYDNLRPAAYPAIYLHTSLNDSQVPYWEPAKYAARLRTLKTDPNPVLLSINMDAGHGGASGRYEALRERAEVYTFMLAQWGLTRAVAAAA